MKMTAKAWAWWDNERKQFNFMYPSEKIVRMCSPDGFEGKEKRGEGKVVEIVITASQIYKEKIIGLPGEANV